MDKQQQKSKQRKKDINRIKPGMTVEATQADIGEHDISAPKVTEVERDAQGNVEEVVVQKGLVFKKELKVPADRIKEVERPNSVSGTGTVVIDADKKEVAALSSTGTE